MGGPSEGLPAQVQMGQDDRGGIEPHLGPRTRGTPRQEGGDGLQESRGHRRLRQLEGALRAHSARQSRGAGERQKAGSK